MIVLAITGAIALVLVTAIITGSRSSKATAQALIVATDVAFTRDSIPQAARDAALAYLKGGDTK